MSTSANLTAHPVAYFHPSHWGNYFQNTSPHDEATQLQMEQELEQLKEEVKKELVATSSKPLKQLIFIDAIERLGVAYHYEEEIEEALQQVYESFHDQCDKDDLYHVSTRFRLLRQHGFRMPCGVFQKFMDEKEGFKDSILDDMRGILSLYEASHVRIQGDDILDKAFVFTTAYLKSMQLNEKSCSHMADQVAHALHQPLHKGFVRLESKHYISFYEQDSSHNEILLKFAKLDFNLLQQVHQKELRDISGWDYNYVAQLPEYFNSCYLSLLETMDEVEQELAKEGRTYGVHHFKKQLNRGCQAWLKEAEWRNQKYTPTYNEYMEVAIISVGHILGILALFLGMGPNATKEGFEFVCQDPMPKLVEAAITIFRLMNDLASTKIEQTSRDHVVSSIQCYIKENGIIDEEQAHEFLEKQVENSWKDLNQAMLRPYVMPKPLLDRIRHVTRGTDIFYKGRTDGYTLVNQIIRDKIASVLVHPIPP